MVSIGSERGVDTFGTWSRYVRDVVLIGLERIATRSEAPAKREGKGKPHSPRLFKIAKEVVHKASDRYDHQSKA